MMTSHYFTILTATYIVADWLIPDKPVAGILSGPTVHAICHIGSPWVPNTLNPLYLQLTTQLN